nr:cytochrome c biogenesis CcdA family protein [Prochlorococcus sp. MIT 1341]
MLKHGLEHLGPLTIAIVFLGGLLTSLGPCSLSLLPVTVAYLAGFDNQAAPWRRSVSFCSGIIFSLIFLGSLSGLVGRIYGQVPPLIPTIVSILAILMGLNLLGLIKLPFPEGPDPKAWQERVPTAYAPVAAGMAFGFASSPCSTPVLAVLLGWIAQHGNPFIGSIFLAAFGIGQVIPLMLAGTAAATIPNLLAIRPITKWIPALSGIFFLSTGLLSLLSRWI